MPACDIDAVETELDNHIRLTKAEEGCIVFEVVQDKSNRYRFDVYEEFSDQESFRRHQDRVKNSTWGEVTASVIRNYEITRDGELRKCVD